MLKLWACYKVEQGVLPYETVYVVAEDFDGACGLFGGFVGGLNWPMFDNFDEAFELDDNALAVVNVDVPPCIQLVERGFIMFA